MKPSRIYLTLPVILFCLSAFGQTALQRSVDSLLTINFVTMISAGQQLRNDSLAQEFKNQLQFQLIRPGNFNNPFVSRSKHITIKASADGNVRFYSWDDLTGGTWHNINCLAQYKSTEGKTFVQQLNSVHETETGEYTDSGIYEVNEIVTDKVKLYITFASGTHGSGHQHKTVQVFKLVNEELTKCKSCFSNNNDLVIEYPRSEKTDLTFNPKTKEIVYNDFKHDNNDGFYKPTGQTIKLKLIKGVYTPY